MSRHILAPKDESIDHVVVGYDRPLDNFFAQAYAKDEPDGNDWGAPKHAIPGTRRLAEVIAFAERYAHIPPELENELFGERIGRARHPMNKIVRHENG